MMLLKYEALEIAISQLGVTEQPRGSNGGPQVRKYLQSIGLPEGYSWCMAFVYWCFNEAAHKIGMDNPLVKTGGVLNHYHKALPAYKVTSPQVGDIFIMDYGKGLGHTGIVERVEPGFIYTIEGNSDVAGSRTGGSVVRQKRDRKKIVGYLRYNL